MPDHEHDGSGRARRPLPGAFDVGTVEVIAGTPEIVEDGAASLRRPGALRHCWSARRKLRHQRLEAPPGAPDRGPIIAERSQLLIAQVTNDLRESAVRVQGCSQGF